MYKTDEAFTAESHGLVVGKAYGLRQGYDGQADFFRTQRPGLQATPF